MRKFLLLLSLFAATSLAVAQTATLPSTPASANAPTGELPYDELMPKGENFLIPDEQKRVYEGAAILLFHRASRVAPDDGKKLEALLRAGHAEELMKQYPSAIESYNAALAHTNISAAQKTRAQFARASAKYQFARQDVILPSDSEELLSGFEAVLASPDLSLASRIKAHEAIAELHTNRVRYLAAAQEYQKILALPILPVELHVDYIQRALGELGKASADATTLALLNTLYAQYLPFLETPYEQAEVRNNWANALERQGDSQAAIRKWSELAEDTQMLLPQRVLALRAISHVQIYAKNYPAALAAADRMAELDSSPQTQFWKGEKRAAIDGHSVGTAPLAQRACIHKAGFRTRGVHDGSDTPDAVFFLRRSFPCS